MNSNLLELFCLPSAPSPDEPTTSSSSEDTESPCDETPTSEPIAYLNQLLINNPQPVKRKTRSLAETVDLLKRRKEEQLADTPPPPVAPPSLPLALFPIESNQHSAAAERLATMVSQEREREVKNQIKQMTNQISAEIIPSSTDDDKRFGCQICHKKFANKFLLNKHIFIHTGLRPHQCPDCHKSFNRKDNLLRHRKTHVQPVKEPERPTSLGISPILLQAAASQSQEINASSPESILLSLFAVHQQQQQQQQQHV